MFLCFIDLRKANDFVDRTLFWQVLARFRTPAQTIKVIRQFPYRIRDCVRNNDVVYLKWFKGVPELTAKFSVESAGQMYN